MLIQMKLQSPETEFLSIITYKRPIASNLISSYAPIFISIFLCDYFIYMDGFYYGYVLKRELWGIYVA